MNAITATRVYTPYYVDAPDKKEFVPILINIDSIVSIEPIYSHERIIEGTMIVTATEKYPIKELYEDVISTISRNTNCNSIYKIQHCAPYKPTSIAEYDINNIE